MKTKPAAKHTPGIWEWQEGIGGRSLCVMGLDEPKTKVCELSFPGSNEGLANARLIAAAPDLLEAAKMALRKMSTFDAKLHDTLVDAISKATGAEGTGAW